VLARDPEIAAVILEPSGASAGMVPLPAGFLQSLRALTAARGVLLIFDEVITGFRWSPGGAQQAYGVRADLVTMAKILAGGLPGGAVAGRRSLLEPIATGPGGRRIHHPGTFNANPLSAAAGIACLDLIKDGAVHKRIDEMARALRDGMNATLARRKVRGVAYGEASMFRLAFDPRLLPGDPASLRNVPGDALKSQRQTPVAQYLTLALLLEGVHLLGWGGFVSTAHTTEDISRTVRALDAAVDHLEALMPR
jgi:glutamate-1-semialdehyde 2,1-aminomutase